MSGHTPGPWRVAEHSEPVVVMWGARGRGGEGQVAHVYYPGPSSKGLRDRIEERTANARLIAAAPEMLAALRYLVSDVQHPRYTFPGAKLDAPLQHWSHTMPQEGPTRCPRCVADAAIAKAEGREP